MKLKINKTSFVNNILVPASKITENLSLSLEGTGKGFVKTLVNSADNSLVFLGKTEGEFDSPSKCIIPDCKTFLRLFTSIDEESLYLALNSNTIEFKNNSVSFKYHLLDEGYLTEKKLISEKKIEQLEFDTTFTLTKTKFSEILKFNSIVPEAEKIYLYTEGRSVFAKIGDEQKANTNEIVIQIAEEFIGADCSEAIPLNMQSILLMSHSTNTIDIQINHKLKIVKFSSPSCCYIVSGLVK